MGETLLFCFLFALITGGFLAFHFTPGDGLTVYDGAYEPLRGTPMSDAYASILRISFDVDGGLRMRQLHHKSLFVLILGVCVWVVLARHRYAIAAVALCVAGGIAGYASADDVLSAYVAGTIWWYALHLVLALAMIAVLVKASLWEAARQPRTLGLMALALCIALLMIWWI
ncbi:hypothetical protein OUY22_07635 [Nonomuraea sp. MCN248]|uniref:Cytochrome bc1 complex cytochrome b subunit n=1 Tax=Nonomuraea corallina TaxID=2989783 RepID=A0ABT4S805_9ACTN|nr:hypothetical protein [Nonomuraea corallina]MDA0633289.1 hypothetical protein [Nonomuraea corallina]